WVSDGTRRGTFPLIAFPSSTQAPAFLDATVLGGRLLFAVDERTGGRGLWISDGTPGGTQRLTRFAADFRVLPLSGASSRLLPEKALGGSMLFRADDGVHGAEPWITNGRRGGTHLLRDVCPGSCDGAVSTADTGVVDTAAGNLLFFSGDDGGG